MRLHTGNLVIGYFGDCHPSSLAPHRDQRGEIKRHSSLCSTLVTMLLVCAHVLSCHEELTKEL